ncbi:tetratricopeptide repeat protein [Iodidimonas gelatinilytica]|uniref:tetratricopeptide repeat protein n=1 Tax=Iodidimonas gelatinilytica TaxID=1236966 RepID=UPI001FCF0252|nr:tetratricopeptide repeat protein [Iodidimonas gelatinilytica]
MIWSNPASASQIPIRSAQLQSAEQLVGDAVAASDYDPAQALSLAKQALERVADIKAPGLEVKALSLAARAQTRLGAFDDALKLGNQAISIAESHAITGPDLADANDSLGVAICALAKWIGLYWPCVRRWICAGVWVWNRPLCNPSPILPRFMR